MKIEKNANNYNYSFFNVIEYFKKISTIPRASGCMDNISHYIEDFGKKNNLETHKDEFNNVIIKKESTNNSNNTVIIQSHLDMVCVKENFSNKNFKKDGIDLVIDNNTIKAKDTSLGADNGIGVSYMLEILSNNKILHPNIEAVFTSDEEIGLIGASNINENLLKGSYLINLDSEEEDVITLSCAGGNRTSIFLDAHKINISIDDYLLYKIEVCNLLGGHSGVDINKNRLNSNIVLFELLSLLNESYFEIESINGGTLDNVIPSYSYINLYTLKDYDFEKNIEEAINLIYSKNKKIEKNLTIKYKIINSDSKLVLDCNSKKNFINYIKTIYSGVINYSKEIRSLVESSVNLGIVKSSNSDIMFTYCIRSSNLDRLKEITENITTTSIKYGAKHVTKGEYPPWPLNNNSKLKDLCKDIYLNIFNKNPKFDIVHAGLECGVFAGKIKNLDAISIGPTINHAHSTKESVSMKSIYNCLAFLLKILEKL